MPWMLQLRAISFLEQLFRGRSPWSPSSDWPPLAVEPGVMIRRAPLDLSTQAEMIPLAPAPATPSVVAPTIATTRVITIARRLLANQREKTVNTDPPSSAERDKGLPRSRETLSPLSTVQPTSLNWPHRKRPRRLGPPSRSSTGRPSRPVAVTVAVKRPRSQRAGSLLRAFPKEYRWALLGSKEFDEIIRRRAGPTPVLT